MVINVEYISIEESEEYKETLENFERLSLKTEPTPSYNFFKMNTYIETDFIASFDKYIITIDKKEVQVPQIFMTSGESFILNTNYNEFKEFYKSTKKEWRDENIFQSCI